MENKEKEIDLRRLWNTFKKCVLWMVLAAVIGAVVLAVYTIRTTETTYTTVSTFLVVIAEKQDGDKASSTTEYYEIQKAQKDALDIVDLAPMPTTVKAVMESSRNPSDPELTPEEVNRIAKMITAKPYKENSRLITVSVKSTSADYSRWVSQSYEASLSTYIKEHVTKINADLVVVDDVNSRYLVSAPEGEEAQFVVPADTPPLLRNAAIGAVAFALLVYLAFLVFDMLDTIIRTTEGVIARFPEIPVLGRIPTWRSRKLSRRQRKLERTGRIRDYDEKLVNENTSFAVAESFRGLRTNISYIVSGRHSVIGVTSVRMGECKSVVSSNLALSYAQLNKKVLLVEGDMRMPSLHDIFNITPATGVPEVLAGLESDYRNCICHFNEYLDVLPVGLKTPPNPAELLASDATKALFEKLREEYELIILDLPPIGTVSDASIVSGIVDQYLLSVRVESTNARGLTNTLHDMKRMDMKVCGFVISDVPSAGGGYSGSSYYYSKYGHNTSAVSGDASTDA